LNGKTLTLSGFSGVDSLIVGMNSGETGSLTITNGTLTVATNAGYYSEIGKASGAVGAMTLGSGAIWSNTPDLLVGKLGNGTFNATSNSLGTFTNIYLGGGTTAAGGSGALNVSGSANVNVSGTVKLWNGSINQTGGIISAGSIQVAGGSFTRG